MSDDPTQPPAPPPPPHPTLPLPGEPAGQPPPDADGRSFWVIVAIVVVILVIAAVVAAVALTGNDDEPSLTGTATAPTGATEPTAPTGATPTAPTGATGATGATEPTSETLGCGTSAPDALPDGRYLGFVRDVDVASGTMSFDLACFYTGDEANQQAAARGDEIPVPNDVYIVNDNPSERDLTLAPPVELLLIDWNACCETRPGAELDAFATAIASSGFTTIDGWKYAGQGSPYWVTIRGGAVATIEEQFLP